MVINGMFDTPGYHTLLIQSARQCYAKPLPCRLSEKSGPSYTSYGVWIADLTYHNVAYDGTISRPLSILRLDVMVWQGIGSEVVFELYKKVSSIISTLVVATTTGA
ncbi:unnamed protein product [Diplocarpon coronariae]|nr:histidine acid phosphatase [Diplocarpon mali]